MINPQLTKALYALIGTGALLGASTNLAKVASSQHIAPLPFLLWSLLGAAILLTSMALFRGRSVPRSAGTIRYYFFAALFSVAGSNLIFFSAIPHVGVSFVALAISLPPLLTYMMALLLKMESLCAWRTIGVAFSLAGTALLVSAKWQAPQASHFWLLLTLLGPLLLAAGNIYRTAYWPAGEKPENLAPGMLIAATLSLAVFGMFAPNTSFSINITPTSLSLISIQAIIFSLQFLMLFVLQKAGGPVFLSLIGPVAAILGIPVAVVLLDEQPVAATLPSALLILIGVGCMIKQQIKIEKAKSLVTQELSHGRKSTV